MDKKWYKSRTVWTNALGLIGAISAVSFGYELSAEMIAIGLTVINTILRFVTKEEIVW